jgi:hypothetical protein
LTSTDIGSAGSPRDTRNTENSAGPTTLTTPSRIAARRRPCPHSAIPTAATSAKFSYRTIGPTAAAHRHHIGIRRPRYASAIPAAHPIASSTCNPCSIPTNVSPARFATSISAHATANRVHPRHPPLQPIHNYRPIPHAAIPQNSTFNPSGTYSPHALFANGTSRNGHTILDDGDDASPALIP